MVVTFKDKEQLEYVSNFVNLVADARAKSSITLLNSLADKLIGLKAALESDPDTELNINLPEDPTDKYNNDMLYCLYNICSILNNIGADEVNAGIDIYNVLKNHYVVSDVPRFLEMLKQYNVPAKYCVGLFTCWCSYEGTAAMAEKCMDIQSNYNINLTPVWNWIYFNEPSPNTDWTEEVARYKEVINGRS